ncbi:hypothetical protein HYS72_01250 [Candidatus Pacearchaeota archaeon]|nr:hypothetical protein [Candidatus Pacearchaeota archaeon]
MVMNSYLINLGKKSFEEVYEIFNKEYSGKLISTTTSIKNVDIRTYDINDLAVIVNATADEENLKHFGNITFLGTEKLINETIEKIKSKGFKLEELK